MSFGPRQGIGIRRGWIAVAVAAAALTATVGTGRPAAAQEAAQAEAAPAKPPVVRGAPAIFAMDADGSNARPLVKIKGMRWHGSPSWSRDGNWVGFDATQTGHARADVYLYAVNGPQKGTLKNLGPGNCPSFSRDGGTIAFHLEGRNAEGEQPGVYLMKSDGSDRRRLCDGDHPKWSPDGTKLLVTHEPTAPGKIDEVDAQTGKATRLLETKYAKVPGAVYSPDGSKIAFIGYADGQLSGGDLVVADLAAARAAAAAGGGGDAMRVLQSGRIGWVPNWSPDGRQLTFVTWEKRDGTDHDFTHVIDADGKTPPVKLKGQDGQGTRNNEAEWSPDGKSLVFHSDREFPADMLVDRPDPPASGL